MGNGIKPASILLDRKRKEFYIEGSRISARHLGLFHEEIKN